MPPLFVRYEGFVEKLLEALDSNLTQETAAQYAGTTRNTMIQWLKRGRKARDLLAEDPNGHMKLGFWDPYYIALVEAIEAKESERQIGLLKNIEIAGKQKAEGQWQANAWLLERLWPEHYSTRTEIRHAGHDGGAIQHTFTLDQGESERPVLLDETAISHRYDEVYYEILGGEE
jgi:transcriptional regulator with XRE-family HTH domain